MGYIRWFLSFFKKYRVKNDRRLDLSVYHITACFDQPTDFCMIVMKLLRGSDEEKLGILLLIMIGGRLFDQAAAPTFLMCFESSSQDLSTT